MTFTLPQKPNASQKCQFQCGIEFTFTAILDTDGTWLFQAIKPDEPDIPYELTYEYDVYRNNALCEIYTCDTFHVAGKGHWYDLIAEISEQNDAFLVQLKVREVLHHEE